VDGDFLVSDMGIQISGATPTAGWTILGLPTIYALAHGFVIVGTNANAAFFRVDVEGQPAAKPFSYNLLNGIYFEGFIGQEPPPLSGSFAVQNSTFQHQGSAVPVGNLANASVLISNNNIRDVFDAMDVYGLLNTRYLFAFNTVDGALLGGYLYDVTPGVTAESYVVSSEILVANNTFSGQYGVYLDATFRDGTACQVLGNKFPNVAILGIHLGTGTSHCLVAGNSQTSIQNLGTDNVILK
jgi:hypothetical protein